MKYGKNGKKSLSEIISTLSLRTFLSGFSHRFFWIPALRGRQRREFNRTD
jgi:hypothetical protein